MCSAPLLPRTACGHRYVSRVPRTLPVLSVTAIPMAADPQEVFGAVTLDAPANGNEDGTRCQRRSALGLKHSGKKWTKSASGGSLSLDNRGPHTCSAGQSSLRIFIELPRLPGRGATREA